MGALPAMPHPPQPGLPVERAAAAAPARTRMPTAAAAAPAARPRQRVVPAAAAVVVLAGRQPLAARAAMGQVPVAHLARPAATAVMAIRLPVEPAQLRQARRAVLAPN